MATMKQAGPKRKRLTFEQQQKVSNPAVLVLVYGYCRHRDESIKSNCNFNMNLRHVAPSSNTEECMWDLQQAAALEELLFPGGAGDADDFGREGEQDAELQAVTELVRQVHRASDDFCFATCA